MATVFASDLIRNCRCRDHNQGGFALHFDCQWGWHLILLFVNLSTQSARMINCLIICLHRCYVLHSFHRFPLPDCNLICRFDPLRVFRILIPFYLPVLARISVQVSQLCHSNCYFGLGMDS